MGIKTEEMVSYLPPKEITEGVDWLGILDSFDPTTLEQKYVNECARRNPWDTCYRWDKPASPVEERMKSSYTYAGFDRRRLEDWVNRIASEGLTPSIYKNTRAALIKAIGSKGAAEYNRREYESLDEEGRAAQAEEYRQWEKDWEEQRRREQEEYDNAIAYGFYYTQYVPVSVHEKVVKVRKGLKCSNGKPLVQRDFAKYIDYPINKYAEAEKIDRWGDGESPVEDVLLEKLVMTAHANPYWLFDHDCEADFAEYDPNDKMVQWGDAPCVYAAPDVILKWIQAGKPEDTRWEEGVVPDTV